MPALPHGYDGWLFKQGFQYRSSQPARPKSPLPELPLNGRAQAHW
ncbi:hypothetical protein [Xenorhabdus bovienii]|nr:hypothetical protein [Xenorhabdus bovienii]